MAKKKAEVSEQTNDDLHAELQRAAVTNPKHLKAAQQAVDAGVQRGLIRDWVRKYGPGVMEIVVELLKRKITEGGTGGTGTPAGV